MLVSVFEITVLEMWGLHMRMSDTEAVCASPGEQRLHQPLYPFLAPSEVLPAPFLTYPSAAPHPPLLYFGVRDLTRDALSILGMPVQAWPPSLWP